MTRGNIVTFIFLICLTNDVFGWTIDLPEVRKYFFEKYDHYNDVKLNKTQLKENETFFYDNIKPDSPSNTEYYYKKKHYDEEPNYYKEEHKEEHENDNDVNGKEEEEYEYDAYMEKKVAEAVHNGSLYLEGLGRSLRRFAERLENCSRTDFSGITINQSLPINSSQPVSPLNANQTEFAPNTTNSPWLPQNEQPLPSNLTELDRVYITCARATKASEHVRRLAQLAIWATKELQDKVYDEKYGEHNHDKEQEKNELVLRLAWFLDRLASLAGYDPADDEYSIQKHAEAKDIHDPASLIASVPPASEFNTSSWFDWIKPSPDARVNIKPAEILELSETKASVNPLTHVKQPDAVTAVKGPVKSVKKRSVEDPLMEVVKYYTKYKAWSNENPDFKLTDNDVLASASAELEDDNSLTMTAVKNRRKRSIENKKGKIHVPEDPMQDISQYVKHRPGVNYVRDENQAEKIRLFLEKIRLHSQSGKKNLHKLAKKIRLKKRSVSYEKKDQLRIAEDPMQDIGYYVRNKPGTNVRPNAVNAAVVRAGLEEIFQRPEISTLRRYGSNYNPAIQNTIIAALLETYADIYS